MGTRTADCRKFTPNIFNKSKCSHCFRQREEHSAAALECNRASRKISKCGYLFVAPDWDFNNPLYRTKRWQRRWFVLYDDGELTYSVDEHPETVPQASVDMTRVLEVATAEDLTGHTNSIAITAPDRVTFVKGTCPEESKWWLNILVAFPKSKGRHKRNATFPGGQTNGNIVNGNSIDSRNRHNSYHKDVIISPTLTSGLDVLNNNSWDNDNVNNSAPGSPTDGQDENNKNVGNEITNRVYTDQPVSSKSPPTRDKIYPDTKAQVRIRNRNRTTPTTVQDDSEPATSSLIIENVRRDEKLKDIANTLTNLSQTNRWSTNNNNNNSNKNNCNQINHQSNDLIDEKPTRDETDYYSTGLHHHEFHKVINMRPKSLPLASSTAPAIVSAIVKKIPTVTASSVSSSTSATCSSSISATTVKGSSSKLSSSSQSSVPGSLDKKKSSLRVQQHPQQQTKPIDIHQYNRHTTSATIANSQHQQKLQSQTHERGDPDGGCNLDDLSTNYLSKNSELRVNLPAEEILNSKKGWLMKQDTRTGEWSKHWFTLRGAALFFYRDAVSEERGVLDGVVDVNCLTNILEIATTRNFGFQLLTWDNRRITLASISANSRSNWINVLRNAAGLQQLQPQPTTAVESKTVDEVDSNLIIKDNTSDDLKSEIEKDFIKAQRNQEILINQIAIHHESLPTVCTTDNSAVMKPAAGTSPITPLTPKNILFSSDEEYRTASEGGRRESIDWGSPLSPSPPIPLSIFRAKDRMRSRTGSSPRLHKRSRSSPPSSRRSTVDSIGSDELPMIHPVQEELNIDKELQTRLGTAEKERDILREEAKEREARMSELLTTLERTELQLSARIREMEEARDNLLKQLDETNCNADQVVSRLTSDLEESQKKIHDLEDRLSRGIEENDLLYKKLRETNSSSLTNLNRSKMKRVDSLSDLTNLTEIDPYGLDRDMLADEYHELRARFEKAVNEIKAMKKELKESQSQFDNLEISYASLKQDLERRGVEDRSQLQMMAERIQDLTLKYSGSERQVRTLKQKLAKSERRRSLSLKGKEQLTLSKEIEVKVNELETKIEDLEKSSPEKSTSHSSSVDDRTARRTAAHLRRRSLESSASADSLQFMVKLNQLEKRIETAASSSCSIPEGTISKSPSTTKLSDHLVDRLRCLEGVLVCSKDKIEQSLNQLQTLRSSRTRRSVSPITDRKDSFRFVERCLTEVIKLIRESCDTCIVGDCSSLTPGVIILPENSPIKLALMQLEGQLRVKLSDLLKQRRVLRERNELNNRKDMELLAERIAYESVCFGKLRDSISRAENPALFGEKQTRTEIAETSQLMCMLKAKLGGKCSFKQNGSLDVLAGVLARRLVLSSYRQSDNISRTSKLPPVDPKVIESLLRQQNELNLIAKRYKNNAMEALASGLAAETLSYISSNDAVQGAVQEAWRQAQETVNAELVQSEIAHIMMRNAERFEASITPSFGFTLTNEERLTFENFADAVHDTLRKEMDIAIKQLTHCYEESLQKMKRGQWRLHLEEERKASEGRQLLSEFADIIAHKALVDARIAVLKGDYSQSDCNAISNQKSNSDFNIHSLQKYENLFDELANDLQISNPHDILAEADFNFIYKKKTIDFLSDKSNLKDMSVALSELEESLVILNSTLNPNTSISMITCDLDNYKDICFKCRDLRNRVNSMMNSAQKLTEPCEHCEQMETNLCKLANQHETELLNIQHDHDQKIAILRKQIDGHLSRVKAVENERNSLLTEMQLQSNLVKDHERELALITNKLKTKESEYQQRDNNNLDMIDRLQKQETKYQNILNECEKLSGKCSRQNEEYAALLQERDYIQAELNKERERSRKLEKRLEMLELEHSKQLECLQEAYRDQILTHCSDITGIPEEETFRLRYQTEIEQLRTLCEKGLAAMESSHRRIIGELEDRHRVEIERLLFEKEQALAEETQATLAALDAMRKAHQSEVQREVARFKQEFLRQFPKGDSCVPVREKEEELEELREEILSFSEKYSIKCVENAALEEKLRSANQKLKHFQQMQQLELRNKQFRAHLASEDLSDTNFVQGLSSSSKDEPRSPDSEHDCDDYINVKQNMMLTSCNPVNHYSLTSTTATTTSTTTTTTTTTQSQQEHFNNILLPILIPQTQKTQPPPPPLSSPPQSENEIDSSCDSATVSPARNILDNQIRSDQNEGISPNKNMNDIIGTEIIVPENQIISTKIIDQLNKLKLPTSSSSSITTTNQSLLLLPSQSSSSSAVLPLKLLQMKNNNTLKSSLLQIDQIDLNKINNNNNNNNNNKPVELPKTTTKKILNQKLLNMKLINLQLNNNNNNNKLDNSDDKNIKLNLLKQNNNQQKLLLKKFNQKNDIVQKKLSVNLNSLSELLINKNCSINEIYNNNNNNENNNNNFCSIASNSNCNKILSSSLSISSSNLGTPEKIRKLNKSIQINDNNNMILNGSKNLINNCGNNNNNKDNKILSLQSTSSSSSSSSPLMMTISTKCCSPSPLNGRDVEHKCSHNNNNNNNQTSNLRRFELEI